MSDRWLSVAELARQSDVPESTTRRYLSRFDGFFRYEERSRGRRYHPDSVEIIVRIQAMYSTGSEAEEIEEVLIKEFPVNVEDNDLSTTLPPPVQKFATKDDIQSLFSILQNMHEEMQAIRDENMQLRQALADRNHVTLLEQRIVELQTEINKVKAFEQEPAKPSQSWWKRIFG